MVDEMFCDEPPPAAAFPESASPSGLCLASMIQRTTRSCQKAKVVPCDIVLLTSDGLTSCLSHCFAENSGSRPCDSR
jgi:hypothetical protein